MRRAVRFVAGGALAFGMLIAGTHGAGAVSGRTGPVTVSVTPASGVTDGERVAIHASVPAGTRIYELRAHLCVAGPRLRTNFDFGFQGRRCANVAVGNGDVERVAAFSSGVTAADLDGFAIGAGTVHWVNELGYDQTIDCGPGRMCDLVVRIQITDNTVFFTAPLCYGSTCRAEGSSPPTTSLSPSSPATGRGRSSTAAPPAGASGAGAAQTSKAKANAKGSAVAAATPGANGARASAPGSIDTTRGAAATVATVAAPWSLSRTFLVGLIGAVAGAAATSLIGRLRRRRSLRRVATVAGAAVAVVTLMFLLSACSSSAKPSTAATTSTAPPGTAKITSFVVPKSVQCGTAPSTKVRVTYATNGAKSSQLVIDGRVEPGAATSATVDPLVHCDGLPHTVALIALDAAGHRTSQVEYLTTALPGG